MNISAAFQDRRLNNIYFAMSEHLVYDYLCRWLLVIKDIYEYFHSIICVLLIYVRQSF